MNVAVLEATELYRFFHVGDDEVVALRGVAIAVTSGEFTALRGPSGAGNRRYLPASPAWTSPTAAQ